MEVQEIQPCKRSRVGNGNTSSHQLSKIRGQKEHQDDDEADGEGKGASQLRSWHHTSSRIFRVSRASGGKDRHSKVLTAKGLRDRRVRLSVSTAIQFYDLQDRLGFDQPSKAVEWLINAASTAIAELPALDGPFPEPPKLLEGKRKESLPEPEAEPEHSHNLQHLSLTKSGCSSTSDTSKGSVLSLSRSVSRVKARERARERAAKDKEKGRDDVATHHHGLNPSLNSQSSFTELLTGSSSNGAAVTSNANCIQKQQPRHMPPVTATADYFGQAPLFPQAHKANQPSSFSPQLHFGNSTPMTMVPFNMAAASAAAAEHPEMQQIPFMQDHLIPVAAGDYNLNFSISSGLAGFNRGTLQSNSASQLPHHHLQRLPSPVDGSNLPFFFGTAAQVAAATSAENQFPAGLDGRLHLYYGDGYRHEDLKGKGKS